jgi:hypothetical protein
MKQQTDKLDLAFPGGAKAQKEFKALSRKLQTVAYGLLKMMAEADGCNCRVCQAEEYEQQMLAIKPLAN